jgi:hypothetical protein
MTQPTYPAPSLGPAAPQYGPPGPPYGYPAPGFGQPPMQPPTPPLRSRTGAIIGAVVAGILLLGGLAVGAVLLFGTKTLDSAKAEHLISQATEDQSGVRPTDVSCPSDIEAEAGATFSCSASLEGQPISFTVTQSDDDGNVEVDSVNTFVDIATVEASLTQQLGEVAGVEVVSVCHVNGHSVLVDGVGMPVPCTVSNAEDDTDSVEVTATVDEDGTVSYEVA